MSIDVQADAEGEGDDAEGTSSGGGFHCENKDFCIWDRVNQGGSVVDEGDEVVRVPVERFESRKIWAPLMKLGKLIPQILVAFHDLRRIYHVIRHTLILMS